MKTLFCKGSWEMQVFSWALGPVGQQRKEK